MTLTPLKLYSAQLIAHLSAIYWLFNYASFTNALIVFVVYFFTGCIGMSVTFHRLLTHKSFKAPEWFEIFGTFCATIGLTGSSISWTAAHRQHHAKADKIGDPHSPSVLGYPFAQYLSMFSKVDIKRSPVIRSSIHRFFHKHYISINLIWAFLIFLLGGFEALTTFYLVPAAVLWNAGSLINTVCHTPKLGYKTHKVADQSTNNFILGIFMWGEGWHNNHHRFQNRANIGEKWWELDIGYQIIKMVRLK